METKPVVEYKTPKPIKMIQDYLGPLNTLYLAPASLAVAFDLLSPWGPFLIFAAIISGLFVLVGIFLRNKITASGQKFGKTKVFIFALIAFLVFSASASANFSHKNEGGLLANWVPSIKKWQDAYLVSIKKDTEEINKKVDKTNNLLAQLLDDIRPQLEKPLIDEIPQYAKLADHQKNALLLLTKKVGTNGIKKYKALIKSTNEYLDNPTKEHEYNVVQYFKYIVRIGNDNIEDTNTRILLVSLFLSPETYNYLTGQGPVPQDKSVLQFLNIDPNNLVAISDPLGDAIKKYELENGMKPEATVVIPKEENLEGQKENLSHSKKHSHRVSSSNKYI